MFLWLSIVAVITNQTILGHKGTQNKLQSYKMSLWNLWWPRREYWQWYEIIMVIILLGTILACFDINLTSHWSHIQELSLREDWGIMWRKDRPWSELHSGNRCSKQRIEFKTYQIILKWWRPENSEQLDEYCYRRESQALKGHENQQTR